MRVVLKVVMKNHRDFMEAIRLYCVICRQPTFPYSNITQWIIKVPRTLPLTAYHEAEITHPLTQDTVLTNALGSYEMRVFRR